MSDALPPPSENRKCRRIDGTVHVAPGWGCCQCNTYNGLHRIKCKECQHLSCWGEVELVPDVPSEDQARKMIRDALLGAERATLAKARAFDACKKLYEKQGNHKGIALMVDAFNVELAR